MTEKPQAQLSQENSHITKEKHIEKIFSEKYYGKKTEEGFLQLSPSETYHLKERNEIEIINEEGEQLSKEELYQRLTQKDEEFEYKYPVYSDLRERGFIVKTGFKFGTHFRVYERGVNPYTNEEGKSGHTKWVVNAVSENDEQSFYDLSSSVRLAQNIRARMLYAVVDDERDVTYYENRRITP